MTWLSLALVAALQQPANPAPPSASQDQKPAVIEQANWLRVPSAQDIAAAYPERANRMEKTGRVIVRCFATAEGAMSNCTVASETPAGFGFDKAALALIPIFRITPVTPDGKSVAGAAVIIPITFGFH